MPAPTSEQTENAMLKFVVTTTYEAPVEVDAQGIAGKFRARFLRIDAAEYARMIDDMRARGEDDAPGSLERLTEFRTEKLNEYVTEVMDIVDEKGQPIPSDVAKPMLINSPPFAVALLDAFILGNQNAKQGNSKPSRSR
jgi:hypothetical protein